MSRDVAARIRKAIADHGPITFAEFMEHALYGPGGFYERPPVGPEGDFVTSPHVHPVFADLVRFALEDMRHGLGDPDPFPIVETGAGDGTLARALIDGFAETGDVAVSYSAVEVSGGAREALARLPLHVTAMLEEAAPLEGVCVIANELLDNIPFRRVRQRGGTLVEVRVGVDAERFVEVEAPCDDELSTEKRRLAEGDEAVVPTGALAFVDRLGASLARGYALLIDYGSTGDEPSGEPHGYRDHRVLADLLEDPGSADVTAGVDFDAVVERAEASGLRSLGLVTQRDALLALGFDGWSRRAREAQTQLLARGSPDAARAWESRSRASLLVDPSGLGRLKWLLVATEGLPTPPWMHRARELAGRV